jgi:myo-inositol-hexaphosphate 3-phosphohydrolase
MGLLTRESGAAQVNHRRPCPARTALRSLVLLPLLAATGCGEREAQTAVQADSPIFVAVASHPVSGALPASDVAVWRQRSGLDEDRYYAAAGSAGIVVYVADGAFLQRLGQSAASRLGVLYAMPVDEVVADFLVAVNPSTAQLTWFEIDSRSGALRRLAGEPAEVGGEVGGLCAHYDADARRHRVLVATRAGELQEWIAIAHAGKQPNFANRIVATRQRTLPLGGAGGDCAVATGGEVYVVVNGAELKRVDTRWMIDAVSVRRGTPSGSITAIDLLLDDSGQPLLLIADQDGRRLVTARPSGQVIATTGLEHAVVALQAGGDALAIVANDGALRLGAWSRLAGSIGVGGAPAP